MSTDASAGLHHHHHPRRMSGRDPHAAVRAATPLELLYDLTFVISFGQAADGFAHALAEGHVSAGLVGFGIAAFAICLAWTNFSWFASAYDTDDWPFRLATMVQMAGVVVLAIGVPRMFASIEHGAHLDLAVMVAGYVVMRLAMVFQWLRAAYQDEVRRRAALSYAGTIGAVQVAWILLLAAGLPLTPSLTGFALLGAVEMALPMVIERRLGGTPWHAHHIVERYGLFAIIALGEGIVGTLAAMSAVVGDVGWTLDAALVCTAGVGLTFGMWWVYYVLPSAQILDQQRDRALPWANAQMAIIVAIVATGAGLHVAAYAIEGEARIGSLATLLAVATPVSLFLGLVYGLYAYLVRAFDPFHIILLLLTAGVIALALTAVAAGASLTLSLILLTLAPVVTVVGYELRGYQHRAQVLTRGRRMRPSGPR